MHLVTSKELFVFQTVNTTLYSLSIDASKETNYVLFAMVFSLPINLISFSEMYTGWPIKTERLSSHIMWMQFN